VLVQELHREYIRRMETALQGLVCVVCGSKYLRAPNNAVKAKVCTPFKYTHKVTWIDEPDGNKKKVPCPCCRCIYKKTLAKHRTLDGKILPTARLEEFLRLSEKLFNKGIALAFRTAINAMLRVGELSSIQVGDVDFNLKPIPALYVIALKKAVKIRYKVDIDPEMAADLKVWIGKKREGPIFGIPIRTLQERFKTVVRKMGIPGFSIHSLRHTGVFNRGKSVTTLTDLNYLRDQARHESIETTKLYLGYEERQRVDMMKKVKWV